MHINEILARRRAPVSDDERLHMGELERLAQKRVIVEINLSHGQIIGGAPIGVHPAKLVGLQRRPTDGKAFVDASILRLWPCDRRFRHPVLLRVAARHYLEMLEEFDGSSNVANVHRDDAEPFIAIGAERVGSARLAFFPIQLHPIGKTPVFCPTTASLREPDSASREIAMTRAGKKRMFPPRPERKRELLTSEANPRAPHSHQRDSE